MFLNYEYRVLILTKKRLILHLCAKAQKNRPQSVNCDGDDLRLSGYCELYGIHSAVVTFGGNKVPVRTP